MTAEDGRTCRGLNGVQVRAGGGLLGGGQRHEPDAHGRRPGVDDPHRGPELAGRLHSRAVRARQRGRYVHPHYPVAAALPKRLPVGVGEFGRRRTCGGGVSLIDIGRHVVDTVPEIFAVQQDVQRHLTNSAPLQILGLQTRGRVGHHDYGHG